jgi:long-chain acyl-CoA synthetase
MEPGNFEGIRMTLNLATPLRESAQSHSDHAALILGDTTLTYSTLHALVRCFAGGLGTLGLARGEHVALLLPNVPQFTIAYFGGHYAGCPIVPLNVLLTAEEIAYHLADSRAAALVTWEGFLPQAQAAFARVDACRHLIVAKADPADTAAPTGAVSFNALAAGSEPKRETAATMPDDTAVILYTSGTTGKPKGAELTHLNLSFNAHYLHTQLLPLTDRDIALGALPLFHSFGQTCIQNGVLAAGGTVVLMTRFDPEGALALLAKHRITLFAGVPTMYFALLHHPAAKNYDLSSLSFCLSGGAPMPVEVMKAFDAKYNVNILEGYGLSETSPIASFNRLDRPKKAGSIGVPILGCEFRLVDDDGGVITAPLVPGEIQIKGHNVMKNYWQNPVATAEALHDGWFSTGDIAHRDADGYYFIVDRKKDMIIRGGLNVYPREIEEVLYAHPAVAEAAVIGVPHARHGEEIKAVIARRTGHEATTEEQIIAYCKERLAAYKYPRSIEFCASLPKGPTGKILKRELRR